MMNEERLMQKAGFQEKRGVVEQGRTPPETEDKQASEDSLADHLTKRVSDTVAEKLQDHSSSDLPNA